MIYQRLMHVCAAELIFQLLDNFINMPADFCLRHAKPHASSQGLLSTPDTLKKKTPQTLTCDGMHLVVTSWSLFPESLGFYPSQALAPPSAAVAL